MQTRRFPRYPLDRPVTAVIMRGDVKVKKVEGRTLVISEGGLGATLPEELEVGDTVRIQMPPLAPVYAIVRSRCGQDYGFEFVRSLPAPRVPTGKQKRITGEMDKLS
ncbi:MAG TPA: PilZ domain-containing protein [Terriglobales bacterium]|nr:PilZ domain-containing protein [Terriglobales bacterium]